MSYSRTRGEIVASGGYYLGAKGTETLVIGSLGFYAGAKGSEALVINTAGNVIRGVSSGQTVAFLAASTAQTMWAAMPYAGNVTAVYVIQATASRAAAYTVTHGSAGDVLASGTNTTGVAGLVSTLTLGTVAVTAGESILFARGVQGTTGDSYVTIVVNRTS